MIGVAKPGRGIKRRHPSPGIEIRLAPPSGRNEALDLGTSSLHSVSGIPRRLGHACTNLWRGVPFVRPVEPARERKLRRPAFCLAANDATSPTSIRRNCPANNLLILHFSVELVQFLRLGLRPKAPSHSGVSHTSCERGMVRTNSS